MHSVVFYKENSDNITVNIKVIPNSKKNELIKDEAIIKLKITVLPIENKANKFVIEYFSKLFKIPKTKIKIIKGECSREKAIAFYTSDIEKLDAIKKVFSL